METTTLIHNGDVFEVVDRVPVGFQIWNIGKNMVDGYLPFCRLSTRQPFEGGRNIETDTLKALKCEGAQVILAAVGYGPNTIEEMEAYIASHKNAKPDTCAYNRVQKYQAALPYMKKLPR